MNVTDEMVEAASRAMAARVYGMGDPALVVASVVENTWREFEATARAALSAALAVAPKLRVMALEWREARVSNKWERYTAVCVLGGYEVLEWSDGTFGGSMADDPLHEDCNSKEFSAASISEAQAMCQADYEWRILAALEDQS